MKKIALIICFLACCSVTAQAAVTDAPHNETNDVACGSCHTYSLWWKYSPSSQDESLGHEAIVNTVCMACHDTAGPAPFVKGHSSEAMGVTSAYHGGTWGVGCTDCHNPHYQDQLDWRPASFLVEGVLNENDVTPGVGTTTIAISNLTKEDPVNWPAANWSELILALDAVLSSNTYNVVSATATEIVVKGIISADMVTPGGGNSATANTFGLLYGQLIKSEITVPYTDPNLPEIKKTVKFFDPNGGFVDTTNYDGICQVCHTEVLHYRNDNSSPGLTHTTRDNTNCVNCHAHDAGFKGNGHDDTHFTWASVGGVNCAVCHTDGGNGIVDGLHGRSCGICHVSAGGAGPLTVGSVANGVDGDATGEGTNTFDSSCADCHDQANKSSVNTVPDAHHLASLNSYAVDGDCTQCHADESGKLAADHSTFVADNIPSGTLSSCATAGCHGANVGLTTGAPVNPSFGTIHDACITCHETDGSLKAAYGRAPVMSAGANQCSDCHTDKLGAHVIDHVAAGYFYLPASGNCGTCHDATVDMNIFVDPTDNAVHDGCNTCHDTTNYSLRTDTGRILAPGDCTSCHSDKDDGTTLNLFAHKIDHVQTNRVVLHDDCVGCHDATVEGVFADAANNKKHDSCATCHISAVDLGLNQNASAATGGGNCTTCHGDYFPNHTTITHDVSLRPIDLSAGAPCSSCHRSDADSDGTDLSSWDDIRELHDRDGSGPATACTTCHDSSNPTVLAIIAAGGTGIGCLDCHAGNANDHSDHIVMGVITATDGCVSCHDRDTVATSTYYLGTIHQGNCGNCHAIPASGDYSLIGSAIGHDQGAPGFDPITNPNTCDTCHDTGIFGIHAATIGSHDGQVMHTTDNSCDQCHNDVAQGEDDVDTVNSVHKGNCGLCHDTGDHYALWSLASNGPGNCQDCHGTDWLGIHPLTINHATRVSLADDCAGCHSGAAGSANGIPLDNTDNTIHDACSTCHDASGALQGIAAGNTDPNDCTDCHGNYLPNHKNISHATKVAMATECSGCHTGTEGNSTGVPTDSNNNKVHDSCSTCHGSDGSLIGSAAGNTGSNTCTDCHGDYFPNHQTIDHASKVGLATECSGCHDGTQGNTTGIPLDGTDNKVHDACSTCHDAATGGLTGSAIGNTDPNTCTECHGAYFNNHQSIGHLSKVSLAAECASCHSGTEGTVDGIPTDAFDNKLHNDCNSCHDAATGGLTSLAVGNPDPNSCADCHGTSILGVHAGSVDSHDGQVFFTEDNTCESCHGVDADDFLLDAIDDVHGGNCGYCHETGNYYTLRNLAVNGPGNCQDCHGSEWLSIHPTTINHATRVSMAADCAGCHNGAQGSVNGIPVDPNNNKVHDACSTCHDTSGALRGIAVGNSDPNNCVDCHGDYVLQHQNISHATKVGMAVECSGCHDGAQGTSGGIATDPDNNKVHDSCGTCHGNDGSLIGIAAGKTDPNTCTDCHGDYFPNHNSISHTTKVGMATECSGCHNGAQGNSTGIPTSTTNNKVHDSCSTCHSVTGALTGSAFGNIDPNDCIDCHGEYFPNHNSISHITKVALATECSGCHDGAQGDSNGIPTSTSNNKVHDSCSTCHDNTGALTGIASGNTDPNNCTDCHGDYFPSHDSISHATKVSLATECSGCHDGTQGDSNGIPTSTNNNKVHDSCSTCHDSTGALSGVASGNIDPNDCIDCHGEYFPNHDSISHSTKVGLASACSGCHNGTQGNSSGIPTSMSDNKVHDSCSTCHDDTGALTGLAAGNSDPNDCTDCHFATFSSHPEAGHSMAVSAASGCSNTNCHEGTAGTPTGIPTNPSDNKVHDACTTCHASSNGALVGSASGNPSPNDCRDCHGSGSGIAHHNNSTAKGGFCETCHHDPGADDAPQQAACRQCHINSDGYVVKHTDKNNSTVNQGTVVHNYNTSGSINDFSACIACHNFTSVDPGAKDANPYHAKPSSNPDYGHTQFYRAPGRGTFNIFYNDFHRNPGEDNEGRSYTSGCGEDSNCSDRPWRDPEISFQWANISHNGQSYTVPAFSDGSSGGGGATGCAAHTSSYSCNNDSACDWSSYRGVCEEAFSGGCSSYSSEWSCENDNDCSWDSRDDVCGDASSGSWGH